MDPGDAPLPLRQRPRWLPGVRHLPDDEYLAGRLRELRQPPGGVVLHCGATDGDITRYVANEPDDRDVSYHLVIDRERAEVVQLVPLTHRAWHAGNWGNDWLGIAFRGPATLDPRPDWERDTLRWLLALLVASMPSVVAVARHSDDPTARKPDPGPGVLPEWISGLDLVWGVPR